MLVSEVRTDVAAATGLEEPLSTMATIVSSAGGELTDPAVVCFAFPGGGYNRNYFTFDLPGSSGQGQAGWHASRGWIFVACDHLGVGQSSGPRDPARLTLENLAAANAATVGNVLYLLTAGAIDGLPAIDDPTVLGIGQSMGGCITIATQGQLAPFHGVGILGYSAIHVRLAMPPGAPAAPLPSLPRGRLPESPIFAGESSEYAGTAAELPSIAWGFHFDDEPQDVVIADMVDYPIRRKPIPLWAETRVPPCAATMTSAGVIAHEASQIKVPVLVAVGERDICPDPFREPLAYESCPDVTVYRQSGSAHMHNFASTRERFWNRIHSWGNGVAAMRALG